LVIDTIAAVSLLLGSGSASVPWMTVTLRFELWQADPEGSDPAEEPAVDGAAVDCPAVDGAAVDAEPEADVEAEDDAEDDGAAAEVVV
jgi:hypothetical protein